MYQKQVNIRAELSYKTLKGGQTEEPSFSLQIPARVPNWEMMERDIAGEMGDATAVYKVQGIHLQRR